MNKKYIQKSGEVNQKATKLINMAKGSLSKVSDLVLEKHYCPDTIQQLDSVIGLLHSARKELLKGHLESCLLERLSANKEGSIKELLKIYNMQ